MLTYFSLVAYSLTPFWYFSKPTLNLLFASFLATLISSICSFIWLHTCDSRGWRPYVSGLSMCSLVFAFLHRAYNLVKDFLQWRVQSHICFVCTKYMAFNCFAGWTKSDILFLEYWSYLVLIEVTLPWQKFHLFSCAAAFSLILFAPSPKSFTCIMQVHSQLCIVLQKKKYTVSSNTTCIHLKFCPYGEISHVFYQNRNYIFLSIFHFIATESVFFII